MTPDSGLEVFAFAKQIATIFSIFVNKIFGKPVRDGLLQTIRIKMNA